MARFGELYDENPKRGRRLAETAGWLMAAELRAVGVDFSFAPVLDVGRGISRVIGDRAFHASPEAVADLAHAYMTGMHRAGMAAIFAPIAPARDRARRGAATRVDSAQPRSGRPS